MLFVESPEAMGFWMAGIEVKLLDCQGTHKRVEEESRPEAFTDVYNLFEVLSINSSGVRTEVTDECMGNEY